MAESTNVVALKPRKKPTQAESEKKWGKEVMALGFNIVPSLLIRAQRRLGINATQLAILLHLSDYWWHANLSPYPSKRTLADRLGLSPRQVQRHIAELEAAGLIKRHGRVAAHKGKLSNVYDLSGLVKRLKKLAPEFAQAEREAKEARERVRQRGGGRLKPQR